MAGRGLTQKHGMQLKGLASRECHPILQPNDQGYLRSGSQSKSIAPPSANLLPATLASRIPSSEGSAVLFLRQTRHPTGGNILDPPNSLVDGFLQGCGRHYALDQTARQFQAFLRRQLKCCT